MKKQQKLRPRVLCLIQNPKELASFTDAFKGAAEFLPLEDPVETIEIIARYQPDIVVLYIITRKYSGLQVAQMLQTNPRLSHIDVLFLYTGEEQPVQIKAAEKLTRNKLIRSPFAASAIREAFEVIRARPDFRIRDKKLSYGNYVDEVLSRERVAHESMRQEREKEAFMEHANSILPQIQEAIKDFTPSQYNQPIERKDLQTYYLRT